MWIPVNVDVLLQQTKHSSAGNAFVVSAAAAATKTTNYTEKGVTSDGVIRRMLIGPPQRHAVDFVDKYLEKVIFHRESAERAVSRFLHKKISSQTN